MEFQCNLRVIFAKLKQKDKNFTQEGFAKRIGISRGALSAILNDKRLPNFETTYAICEELKLDMKEIWIKK